MKKRYLCSFNHQATRFLIYVRISRPEAAASSVVVFIANDLRSRKTGSFCRNSSKCIYYIKESNYKILKGIFLNLIHLIFMLLKIKL